MVTIPPNLAGPSAVGGNSGGARRESINGRWPVQDARMLASLQTAKSCRTFGRQRLHPGHSLRDRTCEEEIRSARETPTATTAPNPITRAGKDAVVRLGTRRVSGRILSQ